MVKNYKRQCGYDVGGLQPWVYLIPYSPDKFSYTIDNGDCRALSLNDKSGLIRIEGMNPLLQNNESLEGRIKYESQVTISVHEPLGTNLFDKLKHIVTNKWFVVCEDKKGNQFVQSVEFFSEAEYTLTLTDNAIGQNRAELRFKGASNFPTMYLSANIEKSETEAFIGNVCGFEKGGAYGLRMIEAAYTSLMESNHNVSAIIATGGTMFKDIDFMPTTFTFTETYAGGVFEDSLTFAIPLSAYKAYWQNSLVEFKDNRYVATFRTAEDMLYVMGFNVGAVPSYTIETGNAVNVANKITITLRYVGEDGFYVSALSDDAVFKGNDDILWMPASDFVLGGIPTKECSGGGKAKILLVEQHSTSGEGLGKYMVLSGYMEQFSGLDIIDEYDIDDTSFGFPLIVDMPTCGGGECNTENGIPNPIIFTEAGTRQYTFKTDCPYSLYNVPSWLNVSIVGSNVTFAMPNPPSLGTEATFYISVADGTQYPFNIHYIKNHLFYSYTNGTYSLIPWTSTTLTKDDNNGANAVIISDLGGAIAYLSGNAFNTCPNLREVSFPNLMSITGESAFANCKNLETCYIPKISNIPSWTFWQGDMFGKLSSLTFDSSNTSWIGERAFMGEPKIGNLYLPKCSSIGEYGYYVFFPTEVAPTMSYINAPSLQVVDSHCFQSQTNLRSVSMDSVRKVSHYGFADCINLSYISLPNTSRLEWNCFKGCYQLKDIYLYSSVLVSWDTNMGTFSYCNSDLTIHIPKSMCELYYDVYGSQIVTLDGGKNVMLGDMFSCDYGSGSVTQYYKVYNTTDGNGTITINPSKARYEENAWVNINAAPNVGYSFVRFMYGSTIDYGSVMLDSSFALEMKNDWYMSAVFSEGTIESGTQLYYSYFDGTESTIAHPSNMLNQTFYSATRASIIRDLEGGITYIPMSGFRNVGQTLQEVSFSGLTEIESSVFANAQGLVSVSIPNAIIIKSAAFQGCNSLPSITFDRVRYIASRALRDCNNLTDVYLGWSSVVSFENIRSTFQYCSPSLKIHIPSSLCEAYNNAYGSISESLGSLAYTNKYFSEIFSCDYVPSVLPPLDLYGVYPASVEGGVISVIPSKTYYRSGEVIDISCIPSESYRLVNCLYGSTSAYGMTTSKESFRLMTNNDWYLSGVFTSSSEPLIPYYKVYPSTDGNGSIYISPSKESYASGEQILMWVQPSNDYIFSCYQYGSTAAYGSIEYGSVFNYTMANDLYIKALFSYSSSSIPPLPREGMLYYSYINGDEEYHAHLTRTLQGYQYSGENASIIRDLSWCVTTLFSNTFSGYNNLKYIELPRLSNLGGSAFLYCHGLETCKFPLLSSVEGIDNFCGCENLKNIEMSLIKFVTHGMFEWCSNLSIAYFPNASWVGAHGLKNCSCLISAILPNVELIYEGAFYECHNLRVVDFPLLSDIVSIPSYIKGELAFARCSELTTVNLPLLSVIPDGTFVECTKLNDVNIPEARYIGFHGFAFCGNLSYIHLPKVNTIYEGAFIQCNNLQNVYLENSSQIVNFPSYFETVFRSCHSNIKVHVPTSLYSSYIKSYGPTEIILSGEITKRFSEILVGDL